MAAPTKRLTGATDYDFMYPDLLSKDGLLHVLRQRFISHIHGDLDSMDKEALVELYNRFILPSPQRTYRNNRRGQQMTRAQKLLDRKRKIHSSDSDGNSPAAKTARAMGASSGLINHHSSPSPSGSRLKPPPSCVNFEKKRIKLKTSVQDSTVEPSGDASSKASQTNTQKPESLSPDGSKVIKNGSVSASSSEASIQDEVPAKKKKFAPISWP